MQKAKMGIELFMIREDMDEDFVGTLKTLKGMDYEGVEMWSALYKHDPAFVADAMAQTGMEIASWHTDFEALVENLDETIDHNKKAGCKTIVLNYLPPVACYSLDAVKAVGKLFDKIARRLTDEGMRFGFHNHGPVFFEKLDGISMWDYFNEYCDPAFCMQLDVCTAAMGGEDIPALIARSAKRVISTHMKPFTPNMPGWTGMDPMIGEDSLDYIKIREAAQASAIEWHLVEYESRTRYTPMYAAELCLQRLKERGF
jgi:sugar phosphate isomerase/epimerase